MPNDPLKQRTAIFEDGQVWLNAEELIADLLGIAGRQHQAAVEDTSPAVMHLTEAVWMVAQTIRYVREKLDLSDDEVRDYIDVKFPSPAERDFAGLLSAAILTKSGSSDALIEKVLNYHPIIEDDRRSFLARS